MDKNFIYFPSLSSGNSKDWLVKNEEIRPGLTCRFYDKSFPSKYRHPYFLLSAGHNLSIPNLRERMGLEDSFVLGDSGGFQIVTGALKWSTELREKIFHWLENNSDIAMNLDIPPRGKYYGYNESLEMSLENFKYFEKHQTGKTKFLNVLHGQNRDEFKHWFGHVKDFQFNGWAIGGVMNNIYPLLYTIALLLENKELEKPHNEFIHVLGSGSITDFIVLAMLQKKLNEKFDGRIKISTDSSSPNRVTVFGTYMFDINWKSLSLVNMYFGKDGRTDYNSDELLPCRLECPACLGRKYDEIENYEPSTYKILTLHNLFILTDAIKIIDKVINSHDELLVEVFGRDIQKIWKSLEEMFDSSHPLSVYNKYEQLYSKFGSMKQSNPNDTSINKFFEFEKIKKTKKAKSKK